MVAYHLERHLAMGGADRASEVLVSFLIRFGSCKQGLGLVGMSTSTFTFNHNSKIGESYNTYLTSSTVLRTNDNYEADLQAVFLLQHCVELFSRCWSKLAQQYTRSVSSSANLTSRSILVDLVNVKTLQKEREYSHEMASRLEQFDRNANNAKRRINANSTTSINNSGHQEESSSKRRKHNGKS